jgi:hypothetical protein
MRGAVSRAIDQTDVTYIRRRWCACYTLHTQKAITRYKRYWLRNSASNSRETQTTVDSVMRERSTDPERVEPPRLSSKDKREKGCTCYPLLTPPILLLGHWIRHRLEEGAGKGAQFKRVCNADASNRLA